MVPATEQGLLKASIAVVIASAILAVVLGILSHSFAIVFESIFSLVDACMSALCLIIVNLITAQGSGADLAKRLSSRFTMGFWHLEPIAIALNSTLLVAVMAYAFLNAISSILAGGVELNFDFAIVFAAVQLPVNLIMTVITARANKALASDFISMDCKGWALSSAISAALLVAFVTGRLLDSTSLRGLTAYLDPAVLVIVTVVLIPVPLGSARKAFADILLMAPDSLRRHVETVASAAVAKHDFIAYRFAVARIGRAIEMEIHFIARGDWPVRSITQLDAIREEVAGALGPADPNRWLTIAFTTDLKWAD